MAEVHIALAIREVQKSAAVVAGRRLLQRPCTVEASPLCRHSDGALAGSHALALAAAITPGLPGSEQAVHRRDAGHLLVAGLSLDGHPRRRHAAVVGLHRHVPVPPALPPLAAGRTGAPARPVTPLAVHAHVLAAGLRVARLHLRRGQRVARFAAGHGLLKDLPCAHRLTPVTGLVALAPFVPSVPDAVLAVAGRGKAGLHHGEVQVAAAAALAGPLLEVAGPGPVANAA
mmetsp:Transcript_48126/g.114655  ORF Transcript_48126/g.114655 Transcript_48126/m.114655 type:complete len:230 (-) Transcript_48126:3945-4634(-)